MTAYDPKRTFANVELICKVAIISLCISLVTGCAAVMVGHSLVDPPEVHEISVPTEIIDGKEPNITIYRYPKLQGTANMYYPSLNDVAFTSLHNDEYTKFHLEPGEYLLGVWYARGRNKFSHASIELTMTESKQRCFIYRANMVSKVWVDIEEHNCDEVTLSIENAEQIEVGNYSTCGKSGKVKSICWRGK